MSKILFISSEAFPLIKTGGLADVSGSLPTALLKQSQDVRLLLPAYPEVLFKIKQQKTVATTAFYNQTVHIIETTLPGTQLTVWLVDCPTVFHRPGGPYLDEQGQPWHDNALRFAILCHAAVVIAMDQLQLNWQADLVHCNDWQTGLVPALLSLEPERPATVFTIHNLAYQGVFDYQTFQDLQLPDELWHMAGLEFYGQLSFIKGGLAYADKITTVSPTYAVEILSPENGYGLDGLLNYRKQDVSGILNGIDERHWNPETDIHLFEKYNRQSLDKKTINKTGIQKELALPIDADIPMIGMVSRLVEQKGLDIILQALPDILDLPVQLVILGTGDMHYEMQLCQQVQEYPDSLKVIVGYNEALAHKIEAASDLYLMPSRFEPCGLNQLYSLRYGTLPIVTNVGGLADTVIDASAENIDNNMANGFVLKEHSAKALIDTIDYALNLYQDRNSWQSLQNNAMSGDFSWQKSAQQYLSLYQQLLD